MHVAHAQNLLPIQTLLNRESGINIKMQQKFDVDVLSDLAPDMRHCIPYLYYGDVTDDMFRLLVQQTTNVPLVSQSLSILVERLSIIWRRGGSWDISWAQETVPAWIESISPREQGPL